jgi:hypothetical protein
VSVAFDVVFGVFVAAILALSVVAIRWGVRRDRLSRARRTEQDAVSGGPEEAPVSPGAVSDGGA